MIYSNIHELTAIRFWDGSKKDEETKGKIPLSFFDQEGRKEAIRRAIKDLMARTLKRNDDETGDFNTEIERTLLPFVNCWFVKSISDVSKENFDAWHNEACEAVLAVLRKFYTNNDKDKTDVQYGKAQKIVNMTMKGLYCLKDAHVKEEHFAYCHIALDSFTLEWFKRNVDGVVSGCVDSWSVLQNVDEKPADVPKNRQGMELYTKPVKKEGDKPPTFYTYNQIVKMIRNYFDNIGNGHPYAELTPFQAEFYIWPEIQLHLAAESLFGQDIGKEDAVENAEEKWGIQWTETEKGDIDKQFERCKKFFKTLPLDTKMQHLNDHVRYLCNRVNK